MRGEIQHIQDMRQAMAVFDLALGGVKVELGDTVFDWLAAPVARDLGTQGSRELGRKEPGNQRVREPEGVGAAVVAPKVFAPLTAASVPSSLLAKPEVKRVVVPRVEVEGEVWTHGEAGGVVLVVQGGHPDEKAAKLALAMLVAIGLQAESVGWVGYTHTVKAEALLDGVKGLTPQHVLVLGQAPLGVLLGRNLGVEGWHAAGGQPIAGWDGVLDGVAVGVTYPLELLLKQPLFKRLAWQHLLAWGDTK